MGATPSERHHGSGISAQKRLRYAPHRSQGQSESPGMNAPLCIDAGLIVRSVAAEGQGGRSVGELPSFVVTCPPALGTACYCTTGAARFVILRRPAFGRGRLKGGMGRWLLKRARQVCRARRAKNSPGEQLDGASRLPARSSDRGSSCASGSTARSINGSQPEPTASRSASLASAFFLSRVRRAAYSDATK